MAALYGGYPGRVVEGGMEAGETGGRSLPSPLFVPLLFLVLGPRLIFGNILSPLSARKFQVGPTLLSSLVEEDT